MLRRPVWLIPIGVALTMVAVLFQVAVDTGHWKLSGCQSPPHERKLLDRYEADRAITVGPPGAKGRRTNRTQACTRQGRDGVADASVTRRWSGKRSYGEDELRSLYDRAGWGEEIGTGPFGLRVDLRYCAVVRGVVSHLRVTHFRHTDGTRQEVSVEITAHMDEQSCGARR